MRSKTIVAIGHNENVYVFNAIGIETLIILEEDLKDEIQKLVNNEVMIFIITQKYKEIVNELLEQYTEAYPIFLLMSMDEEKSVGVDEIKKKVELATGVNLF